MSLLGFYGGGVVAGQMLLDFVATTCTDTRTSSPCAFVISYLFLNIHVHPMSDKRAPDGFSCCCSSLWLSRLRRPGYDFRSRQLTLGNTRVRGTVRGIVESDKWNRQYDKRALELPRWPAARMQVEC